MLEHTFSFLEDINDLKNVVKSSDQFDRIVGKTKQDWLFEEVCSSVTYQKFQFLFLNVY